MISTAEWASVWRDGSVRNISTLYLGRRSDDAVVWTKIYQTGFSVHHEGADLILYFQIKFTIFWHLIHLILVSSCIDDPWFLPCLLIVNYPEFNSWDQQHQYQPVCNKEMQISLALVTIKHWWQSNNHLNVIHFKMFMMALQAKKSFYHIIYKCSFAFKACKYSMKKFIW